MMKYKGDKRGFTLVEIIVVLVILAILAAVAVPSVLGYVQEAKDSKVLSDLRESLIAAQVTFVKSATFEEAPGVSQGKDYYLTKDQTEDLQRYLHLEKNPYFLFFGAGDKTKYGNGSPQSCKVYCIIYQETKDSKPWFYDGKQWSHRYLWSKEGGATPKKEAGRAMYTSSDSGSVKNYMKDVKDPNGNDTQVSIYYGYCYGKEAKGNYNDDIYKSLKETSD